MASIIIPRRARPSWATGFARSQSDARFPFLWDQLAWHYAPQLGATGGKLVELTGRGENGALVNEPEWQSDGLHFDETTGHHVLIPDNPSLTFPDGDWTVAGWIKLDDNAGAAFQYFMSWGGFSAVNSFNWFFNEATDQLAFRHEDPDGRSLDDVSSGTPGTRTDWMHLTMIRDGGTLTQYVDTAPDGSATLASFTFINRSDSFYLGMRSDNDPDRRLGGSMADWAKWNRALASDEIQLLYERPNAILERKSRVLPVATAAPPAAGNPWNYYAQQATLVG